MGTITKTVGTSSRDFSAIQSAIDFVPANMVTDGNAYSLELYADTEFNIGTAGLSIAGKTADATNFLTIKCGPAQSFRDNANVLTNGLRYNAANGVGIRYSKQYANNVVCSVPYTVIDGLQLRGTNNNGGGIGMLAVGGVVQNCIISGQPQNAGNSLLYLDGGAIARNVVVICETAVTYAVGMRNSCQIINSTIATLSGVTSSAAMFAQYGTNTVRNVAIFGFTTPINNFGGTIAGGNNATDAATIAGPATGTLTGLNYAAQFQTVGSATTMDLRLLGTSALKDAGATTGNTTSIGGATRPQGTAYDIGAWEVPAGGAVNGLATPTGVSASSAVGSATASGTAKAAPTGVSAAASVGTAAASGTTVVNGTATPLGVSATASVGTATASGAASSTAQPAGVAASAAVGTASATGQAKAAPGGVSATAAVGTAVAQGQAIIYAFPTGVQAVASVGIATGKGNATVAPLGVQSQIYVGAPYAYGPFDASSYPKFYAFTLMRADPVSASGAMQGSSAQFTLMRSDTLYAASAMSDAPLNRTVNLI